MSIGLWDVNGFMLDIGDLLASRITWMLTAGADKMHLGSFNVVVSTQLLPVQPHLKFLSVLYVITACLRYCIVFYT